MAPTDDIALLDGGAEAFPRMLWAIEGARKRIHLETYIFRLDEVGARFLGALEDAAERGVEVKVVVDGWGSAEDAGTIAARLREAGATVRVYNPVGRLLLGRQRWRNHRKILVVDDAIAFLGGINIGTEYDAGGFADLAVSIRGPAATWLGRKLRGERHRPPPGPSRILLSGLGGGRALLRRYVKAVGRARDRIWIAHAYFLPDARLVRSLTAAARRGVSVTLLLAGRSDVPLARIATRSLYGQLLRAGVRIAEWQQTVLHAKAAVVDGQRVLVGSFNLDPLSLTNLEALVEVEDAAVGFYAERWIATRVAQSQAVTLGSLEAEGWYRRIGAFLGLLAARFAHWVARAIAPSRELQRHRQAARGRSEAVEIRPELPLGR